MISRGDIYQADLERHGVRPCVVVTRDEAIPVLAALTVVAVTGSVRTHPAEVELDERHGLDQVSAANCDVVVNVPKDHLLRRRGALDPETLRQLDAALAIARGLS